MPDKRMIDAMWDDSPVDVSAEVSFMPTSYAEPIKATSTRMSSSL